MSQRRSQANSAAPASAGSVFDRVTLHAFMFTVTVAAAVILSYGPAAAMHHIADVLASAGNLPLPDADAWSGQMIF